MMDEKMQVLLASPRGFCAGVERAIGIVERALELFGAPVFVLHEIVHNRHVLEGLRSRGVQFVSSLEMIPAGAVAIFSAHGVSDALERLAPERGLRVIDATCPLVTKVHKQARRFDRDDFEIVLVGHDGHPEIEGTKGQIKGRVHVLSTVEEVRALEVEDSSKVAFVTQTTLSVDDTRDIIAALRERFPRIQGPDLEDICYATQNRQNAVHALEGRIDLLVVVGSPNSSNSRRLCELGKRMGLPAQLVDDPGDLDPTCFRPGMRVGVTAGASAPEELVQRVLERIEQFGATAVQEIPGRHEDIVFSLPKALRPDSPAPVIP